MLQIDDNREWVQWYIEDMEYWDSVTQYWREEVLDYFEYKYPRGVFEDDISGD